MAVAAAIGVDSSGDDGNSATVATSATSARRAATNTHSSLHHRLQNKLRNSVMVAAGGNSGGGGGGGGGSNTAAALGEINRSIEKMSLGTTTSIPQTTLNTANPIVRRDSGWTNSTEGYGSMRSADLVSRRCSEVSARSNFSTQAMRNSPWGDMTSACSSKRSSLATATAADKQQQPPPMAAISQQLNRLHQKGVQMQQGQHPMDGRQSAMSDVVMNNDGSVISEAAPVNHNGYYEGGGAGMRRASDPVRTHDRNFGVHSQMSRHRSYTQLNQMQHQRVPVHGQPVRGMMEQYNSGQMNQVIAQQNIPVLNSSA